MDQSKEAEIQELRSVQTPTRRITVPALEEILYEALPVLDHGFIRVVDYMGDDSRIAQAARVSYGHGTKTVQKDAGLVRYLMRHKHTSPFEMCEITLHVKLPIFVARQWIRHRTANVNEYSARYSVLSKEFYLPQLEHLAEQATTNNQGRGAVLDPTKGINARGKINALYKNAYRLYKELLDNDHLARELARMVLPTGGYTEWYWKIDLHNLFHFLRLRADHHAQYEIRAYADVLFEIVQKWVPHAFAAFDNHVVRGKTFSGTEMELIARMLRREVVTFETSGLSQGEWREFTDKLPPLGHNKST